MTRILVAPDKFKGSLTAAEVGDALARGLRRVRPDLAVVGMPIADGGDGTVAAAVMSGFARIPVAATGPTGDPVSTAYARRGDTAIIELADVCGIERLPGGLLAPLEASTLGLGTVIGVAVDAGCTGIVLGIGGSASSDGGAGMLQGLGALLLDEHGREVSPGGGALRNIVSIDTLAVDAHLAGITVTVACDVDNPLIGPAGAAAVYGPQKGATAEDIELLESGLRHWADLVEIAAGADHRRVPGAGAAGGVGFGAMALLGAALTPGADLVFDLVGLPETLGTADLVITGEGSFDEQSLNGKAPIRVTSMARDAGIPAYVVCGRNQLSADRWADAGVAQVFALTDREPDVDRCLRDAATLLEAIGGEIASTLPTQR